MDFNSTKPIFITIKEHYEKLIDNCILKEGDEMPSVREVALANGVNPNTVQRAFSLLVEEGYLVSIPKKGFFVAKQGDEGDSPIASVLKKLMDEGYSVEEIQTELDKLKKRGYL